MSSPVTTTPSNQIELELNQQYEARAENANLTTSVGHLAEDMTESMGELMIPDPITAGILIGLGNTSKLQGVLKQLSPKKSVQKKDRRQQPQEAPNGHP